MADPQWSSPPREGENGNWKTPVRKIARNMHRKGASLGEIKKETGIPRSSLQSILRQETSHRMRKGKKYQASFLNICDIRAAIRTATKGFAGRKLTWERVRTQLGITASARTIRRALRSHGYRRCIACPRPFISRIQAKKRVAFCHSHRW